MPRAFVLLIVSLTLLAQYPGQYPGSPYPGGRGGLGIPMPRRGKKQTEQKKDAQPLPNFAGTLKRMDAKLIVVELDDNRTLEFRRTDKTKFVDVKESAIKPGDHISIEATDDIEGYLTAVNVRLEAAASGEKPPPPPETGKGPAAAPAPAPAPAPSAEDDSARTAAERDPDRPVLRRGVPKRKPAAAEEPEPVAAATTPAPEAAAAPVVPAETAPDAMIDKARAAAENFTETLPNFVVQQMMARFQSTTSKPDFKALDVVTTEVVFENGKESYRNLKINNKPVKEGMEQLNGSWSTGEFGTILRNLLSPMTAAHFHFRRETTAAGRAALVYGYDVDRENSRWLVKMASQSVEPAYRGAIWIDKETARVLRIEMEAVDLPDAFPLDKVETAADYGFVRLGATAQFLLPVHAETLGCQRGTSVCTRNQIDFRNYHKYSGEANITFEKEK